MSQATELVSLIFIWMVISVKTFIYLYMYLYPVEFYINLFGPFIANIF